MEMSKSELGTLSIIYDGAFFKRVSGFKVTILAKKGLFNNYATHRGWVGFSVFCNAA